MLKASDVEFASVERRLGGRLVTLVVKGSVSGLRWQSTPDARRKRLGLLKAAEVIARPHPEI